MSLATKLNAIYTGFQANAPKHLREPINSATAGFCASYSPRTALQPGQILPDFSLLDATGKTVTSADLLAQGAVLLTFYRGGWCPYCNVALHGMQAHLAALAAKGVTLVAVSPQLPDGSLSTAQKNGLEFPVLSDVGNVLAGKLGILYHQPESMRAVFEANGNDIARLNGDDSLVLPIPASFLVDRTGLVRKSFVDANYAKRLEPATALEWIDEL